MSAAQAGGYFLGRPAEEISVGDILRVLEGGLEAATCPGTEGDGGCQGSISAWLN